MIKHEYKKPTLEINNWLVSLKDIERLVKFFQNRFSTKDIKIELETHAGDNRIYDTYEEMLSDIPRLKADKELITKIHISHRFGSNWYEFKQIWIDIIFSRYSNASFHIIAGDTNGSFKDWVVGTYEEMQKLKEIFEITDQKFLKILREKFASLIIFDPNDAIKLEVNKELNKPIGTENKIIINNQISSETISSKIFWQIGIALVVLIFGGIILKKFFDIS